MNREQWEQVKVIFGEALDRPQGERESYIRTATQGQADLLAELLRMLKESERESDLLSRPVLADAKAMSRDEAPRFAPAALLARRYRIVRFIARGGMGEVYEAEDLELGERVALKAIRQRADDTIDLRSLFKREIQMARRVTHPNVCRIFDLAQHEDPQRREPVLLLSMELIEGQSLTEYLRSNGPLNFRSALLLIDDIAAGLQAIHDAGIIHGDLKPGNVMLSLRPGETAPHARVMDFGMAVPTGHGTEFVGSPESEAGAHTISPGENEQTVTLRPSGRGFVGGTPDFLAPEQTKGAPASTATDVYAFALVIGEMLGVPREKRFEPSEKMPSRWAQVLRRCLESDPAKRYSGPAEVAEALHTVLRAGSQRKRLVVIAVCAMLAIVMAAKWLDTILRGTANITVQLIAQGAEVDLGGRVTADGNFYVFVDPNSGNLALRDLKTGAVRRLTKDATATARAGSPVPSRDGKQIAYVWLNLSGRLLDARRELRVINIDGSAMRVVSGDFATDPLDRVLDWAPDGRRLLIYGIVPEGTPVSVWAPKRRIGQVPHGFAIVDIRTGQEYAINQSFGIHDKASFSPDARWILYSHSPQPGSSDQDIFAVDTRTGQEKPVVKGPAVDRDPMWIPNSDRFLFRSDRNGKSAIWTARFRDGELAGDPSLIKSDAGQYIPLGVSREGSLFYGIEHNSNNVYSAEVDPHSLRIIGTPALIVQTYVGRNWFPSWSRSGDSFAYYSEREMDNGYQLAIRTDGKEVVASSPVTLGLRFPPFWCDNGFIYSSGMGPFPRFRLFDAKTGAVQPEVLIKGLPPRYQLNAAADCKSVYVSSIHPETQRRRIYRYDVETGKETTVFHGEGGVALSPLPSPDGRWVAVWETLEGSGKSSINLVSTESGTARTLNTSGAIAFGYSWTPDSKRLMYARNVKSNVAEMLLGQSSNAIEHELLWIAVDENEPHSMGIRKTGASAPSLNPDGKRLLFSASQTTRELWVLRNLQFK